jgi:Na+/proline symporter
MKTAARATLRQLVHIETGDGIRNDVSFAYTQIAAHSPHALPHARHARQAKNSLPFDALNRLHVPAGLASMLALFLFAAVSLVRKQSDELALMAMTFTLAILANAFVCGVFSNVQNRYGSRIAWLAVFFVAIVVLRRFSPRQPHPISSSTLPAP